VAQRGRNLETASRNAVFIPKCAFTLPYLQVEPMKTGLPTLGARSRQRLLIYEKVERESPFNSSMQVSFKGVAKSFMAHQTS
jgi:hypothetical protein